MPNTPLNAAGMRSEPAPSVPRCSRPRPSNAATAPPPVEPPGVYSGFQGLRVMPVSGLLQVPIQPCSGMQVLPKMTAPCSRSRAVPGESAEAGTASVVLEPRRVGRPLAQMLSLIVAGTPSTAPSGAFDCQRCSDALAEASAASASTAT